MVHWMLSHDDYEQMSNLIARYKMALQTADDPLSAKTIHDRIRCLKRFHDDVPIGWVFATEAQCRAWLAGPRDRKGWSPATRATYHEHLAAGMAWLVAAGERPDNPMLGIKRPTVPDHQQWAATDEELAIALTAPEPLRTAVLLAAYQGLRRAEAVNLDREDVTEDTTYVQSKGGGVGTVPTHPQVWAHVRHRPPGPLLADEHGQRVGVEWLGGLAHRWFRKHIGRPRFGLHCFRRRYGKLIRRMTGDLRLTQVCLRHKRIETTARHYTEVDFTERAAVVQALQLPDVTPGVDAAMGLKETGRLDPGPSPAPAPKAA